VHELPGLTLNALARTLDCALQQRCLILAAITIFHSAVILSLARAFLDETWWSKRVVICVT
jgi:hypothetical protein